MGAILHMLLSMRCVRMASQLLLATAPTSAPTPGTQQQHQHGTLHSLLLHTMALQLLKARVLQDCCLLLLATYLNTPAPVGSTVYGVRRRSRFSRLSRLSMRLIICASEGVRECEKCEVVEVGFRQCA